jgi:hypothetical protein
VGDEAVEHRRRHRRFAGGRGAHRVDEALAVDVFEREAAGTGAQGVVDVLVA